MFSSEPETVNPRSFNAAATDPIAVPHIPRKWKWRGSALLMRILYAESGDFATETIRRHLQNLAQFFASPPGAKLLASLERFVPCLICWP
jgi:hypothetical protein